eukprot:COSAG04_NODE_4618_length_1987_cov_1.317267_1_plen_431_part_00
MLGRLLALLLAAAPPVALESPLAPSSRRASNRSATPTPPPTCVLAPDVLTAEPAPCCGAALGPWLAVGSNEEWINAHIYTQSNGSSGYRRAPWASADGPFTSPLLERALATLHFGQHRYPGGSMGNHWDWDRDRIADAAKNCTLYPPGSEINCDYMQSMSEAAAAFPAGSFAVGPFLESMRRADAAAVLTVEVTDTPSAAAGVRAVELAAAAAARTNIPLLVEVGNEVFDAWQGPQPGGFASAVDFLAVAGPIMRAVRAAGGRVGLPLAPCPFWFPPGSALASECFGGDPRYREWNGNVSRACGRDGGCPYDAVVVHNYYAQLATFRKYATDGARTVALLALPEATMRNADAQLAAAFPASVALWMTEYNVFFPDVWPKAGSGWSTAGRTRSTPPPPCWAAWCGRAASWPTTTPSSGPTWTGCPAFRRSV